jgi:glycosyltransferase involved in cell wall biosynthesis
MSLKMLSVIIPSYNDEIALPLAVASANEIKYVNEIIIVDDFSSDGTENLVKKIKKNFEKIKYIKNPKNLGTGFSFLKV